MRIAGTSELAIFLIAGLVIASGAAMAADQGNASSGSSLNVGVNAPPLIVAYDLYLVSSPATSLLDSQIDVNNQYALSATVRIKSGWNGISTIDYRVWYDMGTEAAFAAVSGNNLKFHLRYTLVGGVASAAMVTANGGEVTYDGFTETVISSIQHTVDVRFTPKDQIKHAVGTGAGSWNFEITATSIKGKTSVRSDEFGVYRYTSMLVTSGSPPSAPAAEPGVYTLLTPETFQFSSNEDFSVRVTGVNLTGLTPGNEIPITAFNLSLVGTGAPNALTDEPFVLSGPSATLYLWGNTVTAHAYYTSGIFETGTATYSVVVPLGTPEDDYTAPLTYTVLQV